MENLLINYLLANCTALTKEFLSLGKTVTEEGTALNFLNILNDKMGNIAMDAGEVMLRNDMTAVTSAEDNVTTSGSMALRKNVEETASKDEKNDVPQEEEKKEQETPSLSTQNIFALLQTYYHMKDPQGANIQDDIEKFLKDIFSLLQEGESVEFVKEKGSIDLFPLMKGDEKEKVEVSQNLSDESQRKPEKMSLIGYLAAMLHQMGNIEKRDEENNNPEIAVISKNGMNDTVDSKVSKTVSSENNNAGKKEINDTVNNLAGNLTGNIRKDKAENLADKDEMSNAARNEKKHALSNDKDVLKIFTKPEVIPGLEGEKEQHDDSIRPLPKIEVKKIDNRENIFQIISHESTEIDGDELLSNTSGATTKAEKTVSSQDEDFPKVVFKISDKEIDDNTGKDERQLLSQNDYSKMNTHTDKETVKVAEKTSFASLMADRIEKIAEQYGNKSFSMDMVIRLKIDDKESILVGLKDQGQKISVEVKTTNEGMGNFLQSQKEEIAKQLEGKFVYANIYVDVQNGNPQKKEQKEEQKKQSQEENKKDFGVFLEALA